MFYGSQGIEEGNLDMLDNSDFVDTDIPLEVPVPENQFLSVISLMLPMKTIFPSAIAGTSHYKSDSSTQNHGPARLFDLQQCLQSSNTLKKLLEY